MLKPEITNFSPMGRLPLDPTQITAGAWGSGTIMDQRARSG